MMFLFRCGRIFLSVRRRVFRVPIEPCLALLNDEAWISQVNFFRDFFWGNRSLLRIKVRIPQILKAFPTEDALFEMSSGGEDGYLRTFPLPVEPKCCISLGTNPAGPWFNLLKDLGPSWHYQKYSHLVPWTPLNIGYGLMKTPVW